MRYMLHALVALVLLATSLAASASEILKFSDAEFAARRDAGAAIVVLVHAPWCPTCRRQREVLGALLAQDRYKDYTLLVLDYDSQREAMKALKITQRSTLVVLHGRDEWGRATAITSEASISSLLDQALQ